MVETDIPTPKHQRVVKNRKPPRNSKKNKIAEAQIKHSKTFMEKLFKSDNAFRLFVDAWKKTFILRGRSSRYELWCFLLITSVIFTCIEIVCSYVLSPRFLQIANLHGASLADIENYIIIAETIFYTCLLLPLFPLGSLLIRRMHDLNKLAWRNYLEPVFMGVVVLSMINLTITSLENTDLAFLTMLLSAFFICIFYSVSYYSLKFLIMTLFYPGNLGRNAYGDSKFKDRKYEELSLKFCCWYILFIATILAFYLTLFMIS